MSKNEIPEMSVELGREMLSFIRDRTAVVYWGRSGSDVLPPNGSAFFVRTEEALFGVTAKHVYEEFNEYAKTHTPIAVLNNVSIDLRGRLISAGVDADIVTFEMQPHELDEMQLVPVPWPPFIPRERQAVLIAGYPGIGKRLTAPGEITFGIYHAVMSIDSVNNRDLSMVRPPDDEVKDLIGKGLPPRGLELGGMSGGPVVCPIREASGDFSFGLAGAIYECGSAFEILKAVRADILDDRGFIHG